MHKKRSVNKEPGFIDNMRQCSLGGVIASIITLAIFAGVMWFMTTETFTEGMTAALRANANNVTNAFCGE